MTAVQVESLVATPEEVARIADLTERVEAIATAVEGLGRDVWEALAPVLRSVDRALEAGGGFNGAAELGFYDLTGAKRLTGLMTTIAREALPGTRVLPGELTWPDWFTEEDRELL